jgi:EAL domain-containing protein (putative c-di-GMP-specific phosphodiesterase class I)
MNAKNVLLVDDDPTVLRVYRRSLTRKGFDVTAVSDGEQAVAAFREGDFTTIISDISLPGMSGVQLLRAIRDHDLDVPFILVTGEPSVETAIQALDYGALRYLIKPIAHPELVETAEHACNLYRMALMKRQALEMIGSGEKQLGDRASLEVKFEAALAKLYMAYQPIVDWSAKSITGYEALVRTAEPTIPHPGALFDAAERLDRVGELSRAIREEAPVPFDRFTATGASDANLRSVGSPLMFFNLHVRDLNDETLYDPTSSLAQMAPQVVLEITERSSLSEVKDVRGRVGRLRELGFRIAVDDLGAGYAGLTSFAQLEPDVVKLDMALVRDVHRTPTKQKLARSMLALCSDMGLEVVAEGIECAEERDVLFDLGCHLFQGFYFAKPGRAFPDVSFHEPVEEPAAAHAVS